MDYSLAKRLKDAGYKQFTDEQSPVNASWRYERAKDGSDIAFVPTLSELIEACGDSFKGIEKSPNGWKVSYSTSSKRGWEAGSTPLEAVANLWLALNKK